MPRDEAILLDIAKAARLALEFARGTGLSTEKQGHCYNFPAGVHL